MSQTVAHSAPHVFELRRKKVPDELSLPADYVQTDYTALEEEPEPKKPGGPLIFIGLIFVVIALIAVAYVFLIDTQPTEPATPPGTISISRADVVSRGGRLVTRINAETANVQPGTNVQAELLENGILFTFWEEPAPAVEVGADNTVSFEIPATENPPIPGTESAEYTVRLTVLDSVGATAESQLEIPAAVQDEFFAAAEPTPTPQPTATPRPVEPPTEAAPEATALPEGPLDNIAISRPGIAYQTPYGPAIAVGEVAPGQLTRIVAKLPVGTETWYLIPVPVSNVSGWINSTLIDLPPADVNRIPTVSGEAPFAVVFSGGNIRNAPVSGESVGVADAGINVRLQGRLADNSWFLVQTADGTTGWISGPLLTINPEVIDTIPVQ